MAECRARCSIPLLVLGVHYARDVRVPIELRNDNRHLEEACQEGIHAR